MSAGTGIAQRFEAGISSLEQRLRISQVRSEIRRLGRQLDRAREDLARQLLATPDLPLHAPLSARLATSREELLRLASERDESLAVSAAENDRIDHILQERRRALEPLTQEVDEAERLREEIRQKAERAAREGLGITRRREILEQTLKAGGEIEGSEFEILRRRHAREELEALDSHAAALNLERERIDTEARDAQERLNKVRDLLAEKSREWSPSIDEARARKLQAESWIETVEQQSQLTFEKVAAESRSWAEAWQRKSPKPATECPEARDLFVAIDHLEARRRELQPLTETATSSSAPPSQASRDTQMAFMLVLGGVAVLFIGSTLSVLFLWMWLGGDEKAKPAVAEAVIIETVMVADLVHGLAQKSFVQRSEAIAHANIGAIDGRRVFPFADEPGAIDLFEFSSPAQARAAHLRMQSLLPDPAHERLTETTFQTRNFVAWGLAQFQPKTRRRLRAAISSAAADAPSHAPRGFPGAGMGSR